MSDFSGLPLRFETGPAPAASKARVAWASRRDGGKGRGGGGGTGRGAPALLLAGADWPLAQATAASDLSAASPPLDYYPAPLETCPGKKKKKAGHPL